MIELNDTHDPNRRSWVESANGDTDFPVQNLPFGRFVRDGGAPRCGVAIGDLIVDLSAAAEAQLLKGSAADALAAVRGGDLLPLMQLGNGAASALRAALFPLLAEGGDAALKAAADRVLVPRSAVQMILPTEVRQFTDMCVSTYHIGRFYGDDERGEPICPPVFRTIPVGYDGRASSVMVSGTPLRRPNGTWQSELRKGDLQYGPEPWLDYEMELGIWVGGPGNAHGSTLSLSQSADAIFGFSLLNDWSARGIQVWENMLGPFLAKSIGTTVSPWIVTSEALAPFRIAAFARPDGDPPVPPHLFDAKDQEQGGFDISLSASLRTPSSPHATEICRSNFRHMYWTASQMIAHHSGNGCPLRAGDLLGSGTCSGPAVGEAACFFERNLSGPVELPGGETRDWLADGDRVTLHGRATREGFAAIGFGEACGEILPAQKSPTR
ncbi:MAG: fumarylacetoacetase [Sphingopyxis macrogoltabida]|uniref:fumarylacetoacetase n=1 Tax=Sphingopyxis macrogoltabida TaxID=33050 RepID=A0A2W5L519_SPHMC|nr:MAG: fumarylacetoacetase [Sphingopyxis macrogoltabida]